MDNRADAWCGGMLPRWFRQCGQVFPWSLRWDSTGEKWLRSPAGTDAEDTGFPCGLTGLAGCSYVGGLAAPMFLTAPCRGSSRHETNLPAESHPEEARSRVPRADADCGWPSDPPAPSSKGPEAPGCLHTLQVEVRDGATRLRRTYRLRESKDFRRISQQGIRKAFPHFIAILGEARHDEGGMGPVLGVTVSKKVGTAVERNRVKRRIREWFRQNRAALPGNAAVVVIARRGAAEIGMAETERELGGLLQ
jgi:ribonuclease P protein component